LLTKRLNYRIIIRGIVSYKATEFVRDSIALEDINKAGGNIGTAITII